LTILGQNETYILCFLLLPVQILIIPVPQRGTNRLIFSSKLQTDSAVQHLKKRIYIAHNIM